MSLPKGNSKDEEQVIESMNNVSIADEESVDSNISESQRKLFIGGLSWQTTEESLKGYFEGLGFPIEKTIIMKDKTTGRSRGFGFITLVNIEDVDKVVTTKLYLDRKIEAKRAIPKQDMDNSARKFFVGGIPVNLTVNEFRNYFEKFGTVIDAQIITERNSGQSRGFGFVTFENDEVANTVLNSQHIIQGKKVEIKKAQPKKIENNQPVFIPPYPIPFTDSYSALYAPVPVFSPTVFYPQFAVPYIIPQGGFIYTPYVEPVLPVQAGSARSSTSRRSTDTPALIRTRNTNTNLQRPFIYLVSQDRTERAFSAGPGVPPNSNNTRNRGMSHPPVKTRKSVTPRSVQNSYL